MGPTRTTRYPGRARLSALFATVLLAAPLAGLVAWEQPAGAATQTVTNCNDSGVGSLRAAVGDASAGDNIAFALAPACSLITLTSGAIDIATNVTISGPGASLLAVSGNSNSRVFTVDNGATISGITIEDGVSSVSDAVGGAGIASSGALIIDDSTLSSNVGGVDGGAIYSAGGSVNITDSTVSDNRGESLAGGIYSAAGDVTVTGSTVSGNNGTFSGGGIYTVGGDLSVTDSTISGNTAVTGAGIFFDGAVATAGGGAFGLTVSNSTLSNNNGSTLGKNRGGGIDISGGSADVTNSTVTYNSGGGIDGGAASIGATIVAGNPEGDCGGVSLTDLGYNLDSDGTCGFSAATDLPATDPMLDSNGLRDNGGPTLTIALETGSLAIDHVNSAALCPATDQRGDARTVPCDIGAYDTDASTVTSTAPDAPTIGTATAGAGSASVAFNAPTNNGGSQIINYTATCTSSNGGATGSATGTSSPISVSGLTNGDTYTCAVTATNSVNTGPTSGPSNSFVPTQTDTTPPVLSPSVSPNPVLLGGSAIASANASDPVVDGYASGIASSSCATPGTSVAGLQSVSCTATDNAGNSASASASYVVGYGVSTLFPSPRTKVDSASEIPVIFQLTGANGRVIPAKLAASLGCTVAVAFNAGTPACAFYVPFVNVFLGFVTTGRTLTAGAGYPITVTVGAGAVTLASASVTVIATGHR